MSVFVAIIMKLIITCLVVGGLWMFVINTLSTLFGFTLQISYLQGLAIGLLLMIIKNFIGREK